MKSEITESKLKLELKLPIKQPAKLEVFTELSSSSEDSNSSTYRLRSFTSTTESEVPVTMTTNSLVDKIPKLTGQNDFH